MCHQFLYASSNGLDVVYNQLVEVGVLFTTFDEELIAKALTRNVRVRLGDVCERILSAMMSKQRGNERTDVLIKFVVHLPSNRQMVLTL